MYYKVLNKLRRLFGVVKIWDEEKRYKRLLTTIKYKEGEDVEFFLEKNKQIKRIRFELIGEYYIHELPTWNFDYKRKFVRVFIKGDEPDGWDLTLIGGIEHTTRCKVRWGTPDMIASKNPPTMGSETKLLVWAFETEEREGEELTEIEKRCLDGKNN